jgi:ribonucleoside-diphosphate reductase alpha chain
MNIILYSTKKCPKCEDIKNRFDSLNITYIINQDIDEMKGLGIKSVPVVSFENTLYNYESILENISKFQGKIDGRRLMSDAKFYEGYSRYDEKENKYEYWGKSVRRVMDMHRNFYKDKITPLLNDLLNEVEEAYKEKLFLGAQRALQFGGEQLLKHHSRLYNCSASYCDRPNFFGGLFYLLLAGCGVGFSVQKQHISKLPDIHKRTKSAKTYSVPDSIEGWATTIDVLLSSYFIDGGVYPEYEGRKIYFDLSEIRPKGNFISGGFKAPGSEPLRKALDLIEQLIEKELRNGETKLRPIIAYDICMYIADAVISGGVRRSATICLFSKDDEEMLKAKTGDWFVNNPQRGRSNNSVVLLRDETTFEEFLKIMESVKEFGEPAFVWSDNLDFLYNPCVEVGMLAKSIDGKSGFQMCNLTEINGVKSINKEIFFKQCKVASILGTIQAGYTNFKFLKDATKEIVEKESLIGVGITGMMNNPHILFDEEVVKEGARIVKHWNRIVSEIIGINPAARTTVIKPSGNSAVLLECASGIHGDHSARYIRHVQFNKDTEVAKLFMNKNSDMCEDSVWNKERDVVVAFPIIPNDKSIFKKDLLGVKQLEYVKKIQQTWIEEGTNIELCNHPKLRHNVSNTITVDDWDEVSKYIYDNRYYLCGVSLLSAVGDKAYPQAPFTEILTYNEIVDKYGEVSLFTSALIEVGLNAFNNDLWTACSTAMGFGEKLTDNHTDLLKRDFVRRFKKFSSNFESLEECSNCLKDVYNLHKWWRIDKTIKPINWVNELGKKEYTDINTTGAIACSGGSCEI